MAMIAITTSSSIKVNPFRRSQALRRKEPSRLPDIVFIFGPLDICRQPRNEDLRR